MNSSLLVPARYQQSSPKQLKGLPLVSVRLSRALGDVISSRTPANSVAGPLVGWIRSPEDSSSIKTERIISSSVRARKYGPAMTFLQRAVVRRPNFTYFLLESTFILDFGSGSVLFGIL